MENITQNLHDTPKIWIGNATGVELTNMLLCMLNVIDDAEQIAAETGKDCFIDELNSLYAELDCHAHPSFKDRDMDDAARSAMVDTYRHAYKLVVGEGLLSERFKSLVVTPNN